MLLGLILPFLYIRKNSRPLFLLVFLALAIYRRE
jgi:hypothetical protein